MKKCSKCGEIKDLSEFNKRTKSYDGLTSACRDCLKIINKPYRIANADKAREASKVWRLANPSKRKEQNRGWYIKNREKARRTSQEWRACNHEKHIESVKQWRKANPEKAKQYDRKSDARRKATPAGRLNNSVTSQIYHAVRELKAGRRWEHLVGYSLKDLMSHIEKQFINGMTWENYGIYWHLDHITPKVAFNYNAPADIDFKRCWALKNLQPLEAKANLSKGAKLSRPFQPSLSFQL